MAIIVSKNGQHATKINESGVRDEDYLQGYVAENPDSLPLGDIKEDIRLLVVGREFPTASGPIDVVAIDGDGDIYLIETKLYKNPDKRQVVAQVLDYGAALWGAAASEFLSNVEAHLMKEAGQSLRQQMMDFFALREEDAVAIVQQLRDNVQAGRFRFLVLMDKLHPQLKRLVQFLNLRSGFDLYAIEMEFYQHESLEIMIPKLFGAEARKEGARRRTRRWDEASFLSEMNVQGGEDAASVAQEMIRWIRPRVSEFQYGVGEKRGSVAPLLEVGDKKCRLFYLWTDDQINFWLDPLPEGLVLDLDELRTQLVKQLREIPGMDLRTSEIGTWSGKHRISSLKDPTAMSTFKAAMESLIEQLANADVSGS